MAYHNNNAEGGTVGANLAINQTGSGDAFNVVAVSGTGSIKYSGLSVMHGSQSYNASSDTTGGTMAMRFNGENDINAAIRFYFCMLGTPSAAARIATIRNSTTTCTCINTSGTYRLQLTDTSGVGIFTFTNPLSSGVWYRIELGITVDTSTTGSASFAYYVGDSASPVESTFTTSTLDLGTTNATSAEFGKLTTNSVISNFCFDDIGFTGGSASFIGPFSPTATTAWVDA